MVIDWSLSKVHKNKFFREHCHEHLSETQYFTHGGPRSQSIKRKVCLQPESQQPCSVFKQVGNEVSYNQGIHTLLDLYLPILQCMLIFKEKPPHEEFNYIVFHQSFGPFVILVSLTFFSALINLATILSFFLNLIISVSASQLFDGN